MANIHVRSTDGNDTDNGSTWALAKATLAGAAGIGAAGDTVFVSDAHAETNSGSAITLAFAGTLAAPVRIICGDDAAEPPTSVATTGSMTISTNHPLSISGALYVYGMSFNIGASGGSSMITMVSGTGTDQKQVYENCAFNLAGSGSNSAPQIGNTSALALSMVLWRNCTYKPTNATAAQNKGIQVLLGRFQWEGGSLPSGSSAIVQLFWLIGSNGRGANVEISGVDLSNAASTLQIFPNSGMGRSIIRNCKLPASWSGTLCGTGVTSSGYRCEMHNCDSGDTNYRMIVQDESGQAVSDTGVYRDSGASDGTTGLSWKMTTTSSADFSVSVFKSPEIVRWNETTGSSVTATVEIVHDGAAAFTDEEVWLEVMYLGTSGYPLGSWTSDAKADVLAAASAQMTSLATWTGDTGTGPNGSTTWHQLKLSVTFIPQGKGFIHARVCMGVKGKTVYVDPLVTVS